jgi:uncharacterized membrane protein YcaP (DUF421 family)
MEKLLFNGWTPLIHVAVVGVAAYAFLILMLRVSGKRTLSRMNGYDMVVTMALGSILTKAMLTADQSLAESLLAIFLLIAFQVIVSAASLRWPWVRKMTSAEPAVLYHDGRFAEAALRRERVCRDEVVSAVHQKGVRDLDQVDAVILGANGELCVLVKDDGDVRQPALRAGRQGRV